MLETLILSEFTEKDYIIFSQQIVDFNLTSSELMNALSRILDTKSQSLKDKITLVLKEGRTDILETAFKRAHKRYKTKMTLRFMLFETNEMGE